MGSDKGPDLGMVGWFCHLALGRAIRVSGLSSLIHSQPLTQILYFKALGAKISWKTRLQRTTQLLDTPLITLNEGCHLSDQVLILCHTFVGERLFLKPVTLGRNVSVGANTIIGPATRIGAHSKIGAHNFLAADILLENAHIEESAWRFGNPEKKSRT